MPNKIMIGEARLNEKGTVNGGVPGDQTKDEVIEKAFYNNASKPWAAVYRCKTMDGRANLAKYMKDACHNDMIGYSQTPTSGVKFSDSTGLYEATNVYKNFVNIKEPCNCDCSALVAMCCRMSGIVVTPWMYTAIQDSVLMQTGLFDKLPYTGEDMLLTGDIMWRQGHTAIITEVVPGYNQTPVGVYRCIKASTVYTEPSTKSAVLPEYRALGVGNLVDKCDEDGDFLYIRIAGKYFGFVLKANFVDNNAKVEQPKPTPAPTPAPTPVPAPEKKPETLGKNYYQATTAVNLRTGAINLGALNYCNIEKNDGLGIRHTLNKGEVAEVIAEKGSWLQIKIEGAHGLVWTPWVSKSYMTKYQETAPVVGDRVKFVGTTYYASSYAKGKAVKVVNFEGFVIDKINQTANQPHPYLLKSLNGQQEGWCNSEDIIKVY